MGSGSKHSSCGKHVQEVLGCFSFAHAARLCSAESTVKFFFIFLCTDNIYSYIILN